MASIPRVFHALEKREMNIFEYESYMKAHPYHTSIKAIKCVECGDQIVYCNGDYNASYFKHSPTHEGHGYCSLYQDGVLSKTPESLIRKKLFTEGDITLNFELKYQNDSWKSMITIPPFNGNDIESNTKNKTIISIGTGYSRNESQIPVDADHFKVGEIKIIGLQGFPTNVNIKISGKSTSNSISYSMEGFQPYNQIYSSLILQNYIGDVSIKNIDLRKIKTFVCKKISGKIYIGRHYLIFANANYGLSIDSMQVTKLELSNSREFNFSVFDIVFNKITEETESFCNLRGCELVEKNEAVILWPPLNSIGNYKYYKKNSTKMFIAFENESKVLDLSCLDVLNSAGKSRLFFKVQNINAMPFFVMKYDREMEKKKNASFEVVECKEVEVDSNYENYLFNCDVLIGKTNDKHINLNKYQKLIALKSSLERKIFYAKNDIKDLKKIKLKNAIWYSRKFVNFKDQDYDVLENIYSEDQFILDYLMMCKRNKKIKKIALDLLMEV